MLKRAGYEVTEVAGSSYDPFQMLATAAQQRGLPTSSISCNMATSGEYGAPKVGFTVNIHCPQDERSMNMAAEMVFRKALELTNDGASQIGAPMLAPFTEPSS